MPGIGNGVEEVISKCMPGANIWIQSWFNECIYTSWDMGAFVVGLSSVFFWVIAQVPQFIGNCSRQSADGLSPWFLVQWLAGDSFNLLGCLLTGDQLATETITAAYFILADCIILSQYLYYSYKGHKQPGAYASDSDESLHKPVNGYYEALHNGTSKKLEKLLEHSTMTTVVSNANTDFFHPQLCANEPIMSEAAGPEVLDSKKTVIHDNDASVARAADANAENRIIAKRCSCTANKMDLSHQNAAYGGPSILQKNQHDCCFANDIRTKLERVVGKYGLECDIARVTKVSKKHMPSSRKPCDGAGSHTRKSRVKFAFCFTGLLILRSFSWPSFSGVPNLNGNSFVMYGRRNLQEIREQDQAYSQITILLLRGSASLWTKDIGLLFGWTSSALYLSSRISQLMKNSSRKSTEGLSLGMIGCAVMANLTYGVAILMLIRSWGDLFGKAPWLFGSLGTVSLDLIMLIQAYYFSCRYGKIKDELTPLWA